VLSADPLTDPDVYLTFSSSQRVDYITDSPKKQPHASDQFSGVWSIQIIFLPMLWLNT